MKIIEIQNDNKQHIGMAAEGCFIMVARDDGNLRFGVEIKSERMQTLPACIDINEFRCDVR